MYFPFPGSFCEIDNVERKTPNFEQIFKKVFHFIPKTNSRVRAEAFQMLMFSFLIILLGCLTISGLVWLPVQSLFFVLFLDPTYDYFQMFM